MTRQRHRPPYECCDFKLAGVLCELSHVLIFISGRALIDRQLNSVHDTLFCLRAAGTVRFICTPNAKDLLLHLFSALPPFAEQRPRGFERFSDQTFLLSTFSPSAQDSTTSSIDIHKQKKPGAASGMVSSGHSMIVLSPCCAFSVAGRARYLTRSQVPHPIRAAANAALAVLQLRARDLPRPHLPHARPEGGAPHTCLRQDRPNGSQRKVANP